MKTKFTIADFTPQPKMKKKRLIIKELLRLQKNKKEKIEILQNMRKKRGFITAKLSLQIMRKKKKDIIDNVILHLKYSRLTNTKFIIEDNVFYTLFVKLFC
jgi:hypothetical protein